MRYAGRFRNSYEKATKWYNIVVEQSFSVRTLKCCIRIIYEQGSEMWSQYRNFMSSLRKVLQGSTMLDDFKS